MQRTDIIITIGKHENTTNNEKGEFDYKKAYDEKKLHFAPIKSSGKKPRNYQCVDIRFLKNNISVLVETKTDFTKNLSAAKEQLSAYVEYEKGLTGNKVIAILANTDDSSVMVWRGAVSDADYMPKENKLRTFDEYADFYSPKINDKEKVMQNTYALNELLHTYGISEDIRSQFVGTCLLALKNGLKYDSADIKASSIRANIKEILEDLLTKDMNKATKLTLLNKNILENQDIKGLKVESFRDILNSIDTTILPYINDKSTAGQDLLNLFFITFNKYAGKKDKNQAFTPDHITDFMSKICGVNKNSIVLDPCCGSGSFLVRAMTQALDDCSNNKQQEDVKAHHIIGIEYDETVYGLATTNMLIHGDGNSNIFQGSCFEMDEIIENFRPNVILMNPPYNATRKVMPESYYRTWGKSTKGKAVAEDPSKGLYYVYYIMNELNKNNINATVAVLLG